MEILVILLILVTHAVSDSCVIYTFEEDYPDFFNNESGFCVSAMPMWVLRSYNDTTLTSSYMHSTKFISPLDQNSCVSSIIFPMQQGGTLEVNIFMESTSSMDFIDGLVMKRDSTGFNNNVGTASISAFSPSTFVSGWHTLRITVGGSEDFEGYVSIMGMASADSTILVDSFRYMPPGMNEAECELYYVENSGSQEYTPEISSESEGDDSLGGQESGPESSSEIESDNSSGGQESAPKNSSESVDDSPSGSQESAPESSSESENIESDETTSENDKTTSESDETTSQSGGDNPTESQESAPECSSEIEGDNPSEGQESAPESSSESVGIESDEMKSESKEITSGSEETTFESEVKEQCLEVKNRMKVQLLQKILRKSLHTLSLTLQHPNRLQKV